MLLLLLLGIRFLLDPSISPSSPSSTPGTTILATTSSLPLRLQPPLMLRLLLIIGELDFVVAGLLVVPVARVGALDGLQGLREDVGGVVGGVEDPGAELEPEVLGHLLAAREPRRVARLAHAADQVRDGRDHSPALRAEHRPAVEDTVLACRVRLDHDGRLHDVLHGPELDELRPVFDLDVRHRDDFLRQLVLRPHLGAARAALGPAFAVVVGAAFHFHQ